MLRALRDWLLGASAAPATPSVPAKKCDVRACPNGRELGIRVCTEHHDLVKTDYAELKRSLCPQCARKLARSTKVTIVARTRKGCTFSCPFHGVVSFVYDVAEED